MRVQALLLAYLPLAFTRVAALISSTPKGPLLDLGYAKYLGWYNASDDINNFNSIYFAQNLSGSLRWQPPIDIELNNNYSSQGVINATTYGPTCLQGVPVWSTTGDISALPAGAEDCLLLNIQAPAHPPSALLPIMVFVHGGGYTEGYSYQGTGDVMITQSKGAFIWISIQYRLGVYGFLSSPEVQLDGTANAGLLDQRAAFGWIQRHALDFGGDPAKITILGGSAGGGAVMTQMIMYGGVASPPFRAVITQYPWWQSFKNNSVLATQYRYLLSATECTDLACLRGLDETTLAIATQSMFLTAYKQADGYGYGDYWFGPAVDGEIIRDLPSNEFKNGHFAKVPVLVDRDGYEGVPFSNSSLNGTAEELADLALIWPSATPSFYRRLYELYPTSAFNSTFYHRAQLFGDAVVECPTYWLSSAVSDAGLPVYKVLFYAGSEVHGATSPYLYFENNDGTYMANDTIGAYMKDWMVSFTTHLDPNAVSYSGLDKPYWPVWSDQSTGLGWNAMDVNFTEIGVVRDYDVSERCDWFHSQNAVIRN